VEDEFNYKDIPSEWVNEATTNLPVNIDSELSEAPLTEKNLGSNTGPIRQSIDLEASI
jgi:hypothetical protein